MEELSDRIRLARERAGLTQEQVADAFGIRRNNISTWESGSTRPSSGRLPKLAKLLNTSVNWLLSGEGQSPGGEPAAVTAAVDVPPPAPQRLDMTPVPQLSQQRIPVYGRAVGGDDGRFLFNGEVIDTVLTPPGLENVPGAYAVYVSGDSMYPRFEEGETVWVHPRRPPRKNDDVVVQLHPAEEGEPAEGYVKRFLGWTPSQLRLLEFNPMREFEIDRKLVKEVQVIVFSQKV
ncbi:Putative phage repressor [Hyphomicrobiales bacterium]|nr:Putative phage repressor [Hyphomicrobiales bacterium]CAH1663877.1 putative phage repressor [Hyphomicrobiales bacterium]